LLYFSYAQLIFFREVAALEWANLEWVVVVHQEVVGAAAGQVRENST
jgi:hypothetical protein